MQLARKSKSSGLAVALIVGGALLSLSLGAGVVAAHGGRVAENTYEKYVLNTTPTDPNVLADMVGVVGGDVGGGTFTGEVLSDVAGDCSLGTPEVIHALYHFHGSTHSFTADIQAAQTCFHAVITGVVTDGWLKGNQVQGEFTQVTCDIPNPNNAFGDQCFLGVIDILRGSKD